MSYYTKVLKQLALKLWYITSNRGEDVLVQCIWTTLLFVKLRKVRQMQENLAVTLR